MATAIELLETLEDLGDRELKTFKWYLQQADFLKDLSAIPKSRLESADRPDTVDLMVQTYSHRCVEVTKKVLKRMKRNDLVESLSNIEQRPEDGRDKKEDERRADTEDGDGDDDGDDEIISKDEEVQQISNETNISTHVIHLPTVSQGVVRRRCSVDGHWEIEDSGQVWRDMTQCEEEKEVTSQELWLKQLMVGFRMMYTVGYSLSLFTLITALIILLSFRKLHCARNYIHANLFLSLILRAVSVIVKDTLLQRHWGREIMKQTDVREMLSHHAAIGCRVAQVIMQYCVLANHYWFFGEAIYLYSVLIASVFIDNKKYLPYICLGWGTPLLFVVPWVVMKLFKENKECWALNENMNYWWIIRFPILFASLINFLIFMKILKVILSKLRANNQSGYPDYKLRLAKATLTLIPLFGIHEIIFIFATDEQTTGVLRYIKVFFTLFLNSFQGFLVAVLYCYANKEVRTELKRKIRSWRIEAEIVCCGQ